MTKPLWRVMADILLGPSGPNTLTTFAPEAAEVLRAIADAVVPEEAEPPVGDHEPWPQAYQQMSDAKWDQRQHIRALLLSEAAKAERHEIS